MMMKCLREVVSEYDWVIVMILVILARERQAILATARSLEQERGCFFVGNFLVWRTNLQR